ncbi:MAG: 3-phosphoserine/phosphohydroxythreonine transaminase [Eggerthellaceae bacterium]|nr:3-phosphoserine/phosphohydroxythreonine transaminase [Eggerthellaceae bacterium]
MARVYNFSAGPAVLPESVLEEAAAEMLDYRGTGMSVMEMSHRSAAFQQIRDEAEADLRELMSIPGNYKVLFVQGGATMQFSAIPLNLKKSGVFDYVVSGSWSKKAFEEAGRFGDARCLASSKDGNFSYVPDVDALAYSSDADYLYICQNETIYGTRYPKLPECDAPLVADVSSCFLSEPIDVERYGVIYGGVQKNVGPAGMAIVVVREDLIPEDDLKDVPIMLQWRTYADNDSMYNTPPCYTIYICGKVFKWIKAQGGLEGMKKLNEEKATLLYDYLDSSTLFKPTARKEDRSLMNVPFVTESDELDAEFVKASKAAGLENLKGHRSVGGMRASIYNAMPQAGVEALVDFMRDFEASHA